MPQSFAQIYVHLIFSTKNREKNIPPKCFDRLFAYIAGILNQQNCPALIVGGEMDHVHILFRLNRTMSIGEVVRIVKANSTVWFKDVLGCHFAWQSGYGAFSVSASRLDAVKNYIKNQTEHHLGKSFEDEFREFLKNYGVDYDERYVWD